MLEVNAQCGLSEDEDYTSIGAILRYSDNNFFRPRPQRSSRMHLTGEI